ncbi:MAG: aminotransferase class I/II-fold pyridoxal phosphate-dependent enzyme, partial [Algicola sp.]|nr:aminotransferase class I/II-fold pyridoxal phosphate-dependent enzyme [Algicola sp.]
IEPTQSMISLTGNKHLFVLRSVGKFFGLAGIRLGFVSAHPCWLNIIAAGVGPWQVNGPAQFIGEKALTDRIWQHQQRKTLTRLSNALESLLVDTFAKNVNGTSLFKTVKLDNAEQLFDQLCRQGVYVRLCDEKNALRFGVPNEQGLAVLAGVLSRRGSILGCNSYTSD